MQVDTLVIKRKLDEVTTAMKLADAPPGDTRSVKLTFGEAMLLWDALCLRDAVRDAVK